MKIIALLLLLFSASCDAGRFRTERSYTNEWASANSGQTKGIRNPDGTSPDIVTKTHVIEVDHARKWYEAIGQVLHYHQFRPKLVPGIVLIVSDSKADAQHLSNFRALLLWLERKHSLKIDHWTVDR